MDTADTPIPPSAPGEMIWRDFARFFRELSHRIRNDLNAADLEVSYLAPMLKDSDAGESLGRIQAKTRAAAERLRSLAARFEIPALSSMQMRAADLMAVWQDEARDLVSRIEWDAAFREEAIMVDLMAMARVFRELFANTRDHGLPEGLVCCAGRVAGETVEFRQVENLRQNADVSEWGQAPFRSSIKERAGLGLWEVARVVTGLGGTIERKLEATTLCLTTTLIFPRAAMET